jgi:hypothetical protein
VSAFLNYKNLKVKTFNQKWNFIFLIKYHLKKENFMEKYIFLEMDNTLDGTDIFKIKFKFHS